MTEQDKVAVLEDNHRLRAENDALRIERDEARREVCEYQPNYYGIGGVREEAEAAAGRRGWDCYDQPSGVTEMVYTPTTLDTLGEAADAAYTSYIAASAADKVAVNAAASTTTTKDEAFRNYIAKKNAWLDARRKTL